MMRSDGIIIGNDAIFKGVFVHAIDLTKIEIYVVQNGMVEII